MGAKELIESHRIERVAFEVSPGLSAGSGAEYAKATRWLTANGYTCSSCAEKMRAATGATSKPVETLIDELESGHRYFKGVDIDNWDDFVCLAPGVVA